MYNKLCQSKVFFKWNHPNKTVASLYLVYLYPGRYALEQLIVYFSSLLN
jgi:hypothetical protein